MAGVVSFSGCTHGRKQWNIRDKKSSRRLRSQLAEDGCPESQLVLAKQLLQEKSVVNVNDNEENARLGVFWLIKASEQGNVEATNILRQCLERGEGITEHNYLDVKACLNTSQNEKLAKRAAREMFMSLSAGQDFITSEQLRRRMSKIDLSESLHALESKKENLCIDDDTSDGEKNVEGDLAVNGSARGEEIDHFEENLDWAGRNDNFGEKLSEEHLENAASNYSRGELPLVQRVLTLTDPQNREIENLNYLQRTLFHPFFTVQQIYLKLLNHFSTRYRNNIFFFFPSFAVIQLITVLLLLPFINMENLLFFLPMSIFHVSFFVMIISTLQMLQSKKEYNNFRVWSRLFLSYDRDGNLNTGDAEFEFCKKNIRPYGVFFLSLLLNLVSYPFISVVWIPQSEFAIIAFALTFTTLYSFHEKYDLLVLFSFAINVLAKYPYEADGVVRQTWRFLDIELPTLQSYGLPCFASQMVGSGVEFCLNFHGFFYLLIPFFFIKMASTDNWRGTYRILIPHCVTLSWWQIAVFCCQGATFYGLLRSTLALVGLIFFVPIIGFATLILPVVAVFKQVTDAAFTSKQGIAFFLTAIPFVLGYYKRKMNFGNKFVKVQILVAVISAVFLLSPFVSNYFNDTSGKSEIRPTLTWEQYSSICQRASWDKRSEAEVQNLCIHFNGASINWEGIIDNIKVTKIQNSLSKLLDNLPEAVKSQLLCTYGKKYDRDCTEESDQTRMQLCKVLKQINTKDKCHISSWNKYELEISVNINSNKWNSIGSTIHLKADDSLKNFTLKLQPKDRIWFSGVLNYPETLGTEILMVSLEEIGCVNCIDKTLTSMKKEVNKYTSQYFGKEIYNGFKRILNFVFNPILNFR